MSERDNDSGPPAAADGAVRPAKRPEEISERLKDWIVEHELKPGDRLPQERDLLDMFKASKSTVREALGALQTQGLIRTRTGPGGGAYIAELDDKRAMELLGNYFFFSQPTISDIYALRKLLEPELAASLVGRLDEADFERLKATIRVYDHPPANLGEEYRQRLAELDFHAVLAELCPNRVLGFFCHFLQNLLRNLSVCRHIYGSPNPELRESGLTYQVKLLAALHEGDESRVRSIMYDHMCAAQAYMEACEAELTNRFLRLDRT
ncbi:MAG: FCD domain-containing protein [Pseudomonadota bacterium]